MIHRPWSRQPIEKTTHLTNINTSNERWNSTTTIHITCKYIHFLHSLRRTRHLNNSYCKPISTISTGKCNRRESIGWRNHTRVNSASPEIGFGLGSSCSSADTPGLWYKFSVSKPMLIEASTCNVRSTFDSRIVGFSGNKCDELQCIADNDY